jgi:hypothetical protein
MRLGLCMVTAKRVSTGSGQKMARKCGCRSWMKRATMKRLCLDLETEKRRYFVMEDDVCGWVRDEED